LSLVATKVRELFGSAPRPEEIYGLFRSAGETIEQSTTLLAELMREWPDDGNRRRLELKELEGEGDRITHAVILHLNKRAATPIPTADAHRLISGIDDVVDFAEEVADFMGLYRVEAPTDQSIRLAEILQAAGAELAAALAQLSQPETLRPHLVAVDRLEDDGDRVEREALSSLFDSGIDPMVVIRWKDIYERLEEGIDAAAHVGHTLEGIVLSQA